MPYTRLIARLDIKGPNLIKGVRLEGLRVVGDPHVFARRYYEQGADELIYMDTVASLYGRNNLTAIVRQTTSDVFVPMTVGGGIRSCDDVREILLSGADKIAINTAAIANPSLISDIAHRFGSQCIVLSIEAKQRADGGWECLTDNGREHTGRDVVAWACEGIERGAGEILLTSVDREGTRTGFDVELVRAVSSAVEAPLIASGGMGRFEHLAEVVSHGHADAVAMADILHYGRATFADLRGAAQAHGLNVGPGLAA